MHDWNFGYQSMTSNCVSGMPCYWKAKVSNGVEMLSVGTGQEDSGSGGDGRISKTLHTSGTGCPDPPGSAMVQSQDLSVFGEATNPGVLSVVYGQLGKAALRRLKTLLFVSSRQTEPSVCRAGLKDLL